MKKIQILGTGCPKCKKLTEQTELAAKALGIAYELEKVTDIEKIMSFGVMMTPALVVDGEVKVSGKVPSIEELKKMLAESPKTENDCCCCSDGNETLEKKKGAAGSGSCCC